MTFLLGVSSNLPSAFDLSLGDASQRVVLGTGEQVTVPISFTGPSGWRQRAAGRWAANLTYSAFVSLENPLISDQSGDHSHGELKPIGFRTVGLDVVSPSQLFLRAERDEHRQSSIEISGVLIPRRGGALVTLDYVDAHGQPASKLVRTEDGGRFETHVSTLSGSAVSAVWAGDREYAPATAVLKSFGQNDRDRQA